MAYDLVKKQNEEDSFMLNDDEMMMVVMSVMMMAMLMQMMSSMFARPTSSNSTQASGFRQNATMAMQSLIFSTPVQAASIINDGTLSYIYLYVNSLDAEPIELRPGDTANIELDSASLSVIHYCTRGGAAEFRVSVVY